MTIHFLQILLTIATLFSAYSKQQISYSLEDETALYFVYFKDKPQVSTFDVADYFHPKARERRVNNHLAPFDFRDLPLNPSYVSRVGEIAYTLRYELRWLNAVSIQASHSQIEIISQLAFVKEIERFGVASHIAPLAEVELASPKPTSGKLDTLLSLTRSLMQLDSLESHEFTGKGIRIAVLDAGFQEANTHQALAHIRSNNRIIETKNFYEGTDNVYNHSTHGTEVMSCIAGMMDGRQLGAAKDAEFLLARTEHERKEFPREEDHWIAAAEWADRLGADIINSSVTFTRLRYTYQDMDGETAPVSRAATIAAQKGILVICSMGNEGNSDWKYMGAPADAPEVLSVAGSMPMLPMRIKFSSIGPNVRGELKPDIAAPAYVVTTDKRNKYQIRAGTSFASPLIAGFTACMLQMNPKATRTEITHKLKKIGHYSPYYDYFLGFGIPQAKRLFIDSIPKIDPTFTLRTKQDTLFFDFNPEVMIKDSVLHKSGRVLNYHLSNPKGKLLAYNFELIPNKSKSYFILRSPNSEGLLRIWFEGYLEEYLLEKME